MFCKNCGAKAIDGAEFCQKCGSKLTTETETASSSAEAQSGQETATNNTAEKKTRSSKRKLLLVLLPVAVIVMILAAVGIPEIIDRYEAAQAEKIIAKLKEQTPFDDGEATSRWGINTTPSYGEVFDYALGTAHWEVTDIGAREAYAYGRTDYTNDNISIYFEYDEIFPHKIECGSKLFVGVDEVKTFLYDMFDAYVSGEDFIPSTFPKFCGRTYAENTMSGYYRCYENKYIGLNLTLPYNSEYSWRFYSDYEMENEGMPTKRSITDASTMGFGTEIYDVMAIDNYTGDNIIIDFIYLGGMDIDLDSALYELYYGLLDEDNYPRMSLVSSYEHVELGGLRTITCLFNGYSENGVFIFQKHYLAIVDDVAVYILISTTDESHISSIEAKFSPM